MASVVPGQHRFTGGVVDHPAVTGIHAVLEQQIAGNVVTGNAAGWNVLDLRLIKFVDCSRQLDGVMYCITRLLRASRIHSGLPSASSLVKVRYFSSFSAPAASLDTIVGDRNHVSAKAVQNGEGGGVAVRFDRLCGTSVFRRIELANRAIAGFMRRSYQSLRSAESGSNAVSLAS